MSSKFSLTKQPKIAIVHDYLREYGGAEKVVESLNEIWPDAKIYTANYEESVMDHYNFKVPKGLINTTFIQSLPFHNKLRKHLFFTYPIAFKLLRINADIIISSSSYASKFVKKPKGSLHISYTHSLPKFLWGYETETPAFETLPIDRYLKPLYKKTLPKITSILKKLDFEAAKNVDFFIANSFLTKERIKNNYKRDSKIIHPPVDVKKFNGPINNNNYYLIVSRLSSFKKIDLAIRAFNKNGLSLKIIGEGQELESLKRISHSNVRFLGGVSGKELLKELLNCTALVFPTFEDFGIVPVEAMAAGKPVIAFKGGGALETVVAGKTGEFFEKQTSESLLEVIKKFDALRYNPTDCRDQASKFSKDEFKRKIKYFVEEAWSIKK